jgi:O-antigen/teichoic acid export membrane protein
VAFLAGTVVQDVLLTTSVFRRFGSCLPSFDLASLRSLLRTSLPMGFTTAMIVVYWSTGTVLLGFLRGNAQVGWYNAAMKIVIVLMVVPQLYNQAMVPSISALFVQSLPRLERLIAESIRLMAFLAAPIMVGGILLARKIIYFLYGTRYDQSAVCLQIMFVAVAVIYIVSPMGSLLLYSGREKLFMAAVTTGALVNVGVNLSLIPWIGIKGAAAATVICELAVSAIMYHGANQVVPVRPLNSLWRPFLSCFPMALVLVLSRNMALGWQVLLGALVYLVTVTLLGGLRKEDLRVATSMVRSKASPVA